jgi:hypothetical protein
MGAETPRAIRVETIPSLKLRIGFTNGLSLRPKADPQARLARMPGLGAPEEAGRVGSLLNRAPPAATQHFPVTDV